MFEYDPVTKQVSYINKVFFLRSIELIWVCKMLLRQ